MRTAICSIQLQALTPEAATVVKQAVNLATRRGHAQVTPLHVASSMLATSTGLLKRACLQLHSHPLQCKALELCFNVALNRLPASSSTVVPISPLLCGPQYNSSTTPSLSNALVAAFKRAQAHQRRGSIENNQQQHVLALKIEVEQLIISILDDPSVSRVMREAGFSSTLVKTRVEQSVSMEVSSQKESTKPHHALGGSSSTSVSQSLVPFGHFRGSFVKPMDRVINNDDVSSVLSELLNKRRNMVIVGESLVNAEGVARGVMERFEIGNVPGDLRFVQFVSVPLVNFRNISKEEVEQKLVELRCLVKSYVGRGVILYLGDLKWLFEFWSNYCEQRRTNYCYCSVEHMVMEIKKLISGSGNTSRMWLMGIATFRTYMKGKIYHPSLETIWDLHPFTIPAGSLNLSLNLDSDFQAQERSKVIFKDGFVDDQVVEAHKHLTCCRDCSLSFQREAQSIADSKSNKVCTTSLPTWLRSCKEDKSHIIEDQDNERLKDLCKKWNSFCSSVHRHPSSPTSVSSHERKTNLHHSYLSWPLISEPKESRLYSTETGDDDCCDGNLIMFMPDHDVPKPDLLSNPNSSPNSASSSEAMDGLESTEMFKEHNAENLKILCDALEKKVPLHKEIIPEIASTVLTCRSGIRKRQNHLIKREDKLETWMLFLGMHSNHDKEKISRELAKVVFGSYSNFVTIGISSFSSPRGSDSTDEEKSKNKRPRDELGSTYLQRFWEAANENPHRVFFMEDLDQVDYFSQKGVKQAIQSGSITLPGGESVPLKDAIVIFCCESFTSVSRSPARTSISDENKGRENMDNLKEKSPSLSLDLNIATEDDDTQDVPLGGDTGILELVDLQINFKLPEL